MDSKLRDAAFNKSDEYFKDVRLKYAKPKSFKKVKTKLKGYERCPTCGGMVIMPCVLCNPSTLIYAEHRINKHTKVFDTLKELALHLDKYTAGEDIDSKALSHLSS